MLSATQSAYRLLAASSAFILWGSWAWYINARQDSASGLKAALVQGSASFIITLLMVHMVNWIFRRQHRPFSQLFIPPLVTVSVTGTALVSIHYLMATPDILRTVFPALAVAFLFCLFTALKLQAGTKDD
ncbi:hypothetical protein [Aliamphritea hakodatensis]|uniref:hypothetical protein n=1 Tax=Aliamphritea hakodatensis TaxID=2895352 RepID=UPI0022FD39D2|nr:hypothetical protein [Aliamphritea hakodatensis]